MNALEIKGLSKSYKDFKLDSVSFELPDGCILRLIGENGAGKSTIIKLILNMIKREEGTIIVLGRDNREKFELTKEDIGVVLDDIGFPECVTAKQINNIMRYTYKNWDENQYYEYIRRFDIPENKQFKEYSRGTRMKLGIAVALSHNPKLLILDEATNGLDPVVRDEITGIFSEFTREESHSILISSHIVSDLEKICDYIAFLHKGKLMLYEEKDRLLEDYALVQCSAEDFGRIRREGIKGVKKSVYNVEAVVERRCVPAGMRVSPVTIEELFVFMAKEGEAV